MRGANAASAGAAQPGVQAELDVLQLVPAVRSTPGRPRPATSRAPRRTSSSECARIASAGSGEPPTRQRSSIRSVTSSPAALRASCTIRTTSRTRPASRSSCVSSRSSATVSEPPDATAHPDRGVSLIVTMSPASGSVSPSSSTVIVPVAVAVDERVDVVGRCGRDRVGDLLGALAEHPAELAEVRLDRDLDELARVGEGRPARRR